ncbi:glycosyltransferase family 2 protein [Candidatus Pelagibacter sp.]|nr:glycosyltransferase family 2 protein [Candidatus Pelagibacter sp.]
MKKKKISYSKIKLSIIIPIYNEEKTIAKILHKIKKVAHKNSLNIEIIVINDGSTDKSYTILKNLNKSYDQIINYKMNMGKGYAIRKGLKKARGQIIIIQDADLEYDPHDYINLISPIIKKKSNIVYGSRVLNKSKRKISNTFSNKFRVFANYVLTILSNIINRQNLTDAHTCYKVFKKQLVNKLNLKENGFSFCPEITTKFSNLNEPIIEIPISYKGRSYKEGKKIKFEDGISAIITLFKYKFF